MRIKQEKIIMFIRQASNMGNHKQRLISNIKKIQKTDLIFLAFGLSLVLSGCGKPIYIESYEFMSGTVAKLNESASCKLAE